VNTYRFSFMRLCPSDGALIDYRLEISTRQTIMVEDLISACVQVGPVYHEALAEDLLARFGGRQTLEAVHQGVTVTTVRP
jgi:hypothetical protein